MDYGIPVGHYAACFCGNLNLGPVYPQFLHSLPDGTFLGSFPFLHHAAGKAYLPRLPYPFGPQLEQDCILFFPDKGNKYRKMIFEPFP